MTARARRSTKAPVGRYKLAYSPGTELARRYPEPTTTRFATFDLADSIRRAMPNPDQIDVIALEEPS